MAGKIEIPYRECPCCGKTKKVTAENFYKSYSVMYKNAFENRLHICKTCVIDIANEFEIKFKSEIQALYHLCQLIDMYYEESVYNVAKNQAEKNNNNVYKIYFQKVLSLPQHAKKTFADSEVVKSSFATKTTEDGSRLDGVEQEVIDFWGDGYLKNDYDFFEREFGNLTTRYECDSYAQEMLFQEIVFTKWDIRKKRQQGVNVDKEVRSLQELLGSANIKPAQENASMASEQVTFGTLIKKYENEKPIPEALPEWMNADWIGRYMRTWFFGALARMMGKSNEYQEEFDEEIGKYTVKPPGEDGEE